MSLPENPATETTNDTLPWLSGGSVRDLTGATLGDFHVERLLGRGGMGEVYLATQLSLNRPVALKVLRPDLLTKATYLSRFEAEATAVAKLNHPNIVHIYTLGALDGFRFIAMEYVQGSNLREYLRKKGALDYPLALSIMRQAGVAVGAAGELGLIHRDIKPENLLLTRKGQVKVADFGLCRDLDAERVNLTQTGITMGTPAYMSPEQAQGHALDHRSDLYSLGVTFYHMLAGVPPFTAETPIAVALKHVKDKPASISVHRPDIHPELDRLVLKLMAKSPADRYQSAAEMLKDLGRVREALHAPTGVQPVADVPGPSVATEPVSAHGGASTAAAGPVTGGRRPRVRLGGGEGARPWPGPRAGAAIALLALAAGAALGWLGRPDDLLSAAAPPPAAPPGLWIDPRWKDVERTGSAEAQYAYAQVRAPKDLLDAAWLAVPGFFPDAREWSARAYTQLARSLLLTHDVDRLRTLADEIEGWEGSHSHEKKLAAVIRAGVEALEGDPDDVVEGFTRIAPSQLTDPALLGLCLEVVDQAERLGLAPGSPGSSNRLAQENIRRLRTEIISTLGKTGLRSPFYVNLRYPKE